MCNDEMTKASTARFGPIVALRARVSDGVFASPYLPFTEYIGSSVWKSRHLKKCEILDV